MHDSIYRFFQNLKTQYPPESITRAYHGGVPAPYYIIDDFLPRAVYDAVIDTFPDIPEERYETYRDSSSERKECTNFSEAPLLQTLANSFNSKQSVDWLKETMGSSPLIPDPYFTGGGLCRSVRNSALGLHTDLEWNGALKLRRTNVAVLYMVREWRPEWNGRLEFWDDDKTECLMTVEPKPNRFIFWDMAILKQNNMQWHGFTKPVLCPQHLSRDVLALFYYQSDATSGEEPRT
jgi:hypothetical protein